MFLTTSYMVGITARVESTLKSEDRSNTKSKDNVGPNGSTIAKINKNQIL